MARILKRLILALWMLLTVYAVLVMLVGSVYFLVDEPTKWYSWVIAVLAIPEALGIAKTVIADDLREWQHS